ncbi:MAG: exosortase/archaeosortase family protein [Opitutaceae bacterium]|nr:exosortase/archaeosortase family protein [Opitutaceae bacterium]
MHTVPPPPTPAPQIWTGWTAPARAIVVALLVLAAAFSINLWSDWRHNPELSHGFFAPLVFLLLLWEGSRRGTARWLRSGPWLLAGQCAVLGGAFLWFAFAGLLAASVGWPHAAVSFSLAISLSLFLSGGLLYLASDRVRAMPFNWTILTAIWLWILAAPIPPGTYARLSLKLQLWVTTSVLHTLHVLGVPARQEGNLIDLATATVGIEEACSGIRSLVSCLYAGLFFAAWQVRSRVGRVVLILLAAPLAIGMNFLRSLTLTLMANANMTITGFWHDATGYAILVVTAGILALLAIAFESPQPAAVAAGTAFTDDPDPTPYRPNWQLRTFWAGLAAMLSLGLFYYVQTRPAAKPAGPPPDLAALFPENTHGWSTLPPQNLAIFSTTLGTDNLAQRTYFKPVGDPAPQITVYVAYWPAGQVSVSSVASHTPEACWPGAGWQPVPAPILPQTLSVPGHTLPRAEYRLFRRDDGFSQHVWFWHIYDNRVIDYRDPYSVSALIELALRYGFRRQGDQVFVRLSSNQSWPEIASDPLMQDICARLTRIGL